MSKAQEIAVRLSMAALLLIIGLGFARPVAAQAPTPVSDGSDPKCPMGHVLQQNETLWDIAQASGIELASLKAQNPWYGDGVYQVSYRKMAVGACINLNLNDWSKPSQPSEVMAENCAAMPGICMSAPSKEARTAYEVAVGWKVPSLPTQVATAQPTATAIVITTSTPQPPVVTNPNTCGWFARLIGWCD